MRGPPLALIAVAAWLAPLEARGEVVAPRLPGPVPWQEPSPLARLFLQLPFEAPATVGPGALRGDVRLVYSNNLLVARNEKMALDVHVETAQLTGLLRRGLRDGLELQLAVPVLLDTGGFLDRPIEIVEGMLGAVSPQRVGRPRGVATFRVVRADGSGIDREGPAAGIGDAWAGAKVELAPEGGLRPALSLRGAVKVPTGSPPFGSGTVDVGGGLLSGWSGERLAVRVEVDIATPTSSLRVVRITTRPYGAAQADLAWEAAGRLALHLQASGHLSPLGGTGLGQVDSPTFYTLVGVGVSLPGALELTGGVVENVFSPYRGSDLSFVLGLAAR
jgi:hypothetical protein